MTTKVRTVSLFFCTSRQKTDDFADLEIIRVGPMQTTGTYVFDVKDLSKETTTRAALSFARQQLMQTIAENGYNVLTLERFAAFFYLPSQMPT